MRIDGRYAYGSFHQLLSDSLRGAEVYLSYGEVVERLRAAGGLIEMAGGVPCRMRMPGGNIAIPLPAHREQGDPYYAAYRLCITAVAELYVGGRTLLVSPQFVRWETGEAMNDQVFVTDRSDKEIIFRTFQVIPKSLSLPEPVLQLPVPDWCAVEGSALVSEIYSRWMFISDARRYGMEYIEALREKTGIRI